LSNSAAIYTYDHRHAEAIQNGKRWRLWKTAWQYPEIRTRHVCEKLTGSNRATPFPSQGIAGVSSLVIDPTTIQLQHKTLYFVVFQL